MLVDQWTLSFFLGDSLNPSVSPLIGLFASPLWTQTFTTALMVQVFLPPFKRRVGSFDWPRPPPPAHSFWRRFPTSARKWLEPHCPSGFLVQAFFCWVGFQFSLRCHLSSPFLLSPVIRRAFVCRGLSDRRPRRPPPIFFPKLLTSIYLESFPGRAPLDVPLFSFRTVFPFFFLASEFCPLACGTSCLFF